MRRMLAKFTSTVLQDNTNDMTQLVSGLQSCLALTDKLDLAMVAIHIEQARSWLIEHGLDGPVGPESFSDPHADPVP